MSPGPWAWAPPKHHAQPFAATFPRLTLSETRGVELCGAHLPGRRGGGSGLLSRLKYTRHAPGPTACTCCTQPHSYTASPSRPPATLLFFESQNTLRTISELWGNYKKYIENIILPDLNTVLCVIPTRHSFQRSDKFSPDTALGNGSIFLFPRFSRDPSEKFEKNLKKIGYLDFNAD